MIPKMLPLLALVFAGILPTSAAANAMGAPCCAAERHVALFLAQAGVRNAVPAPGKPASEEIPAVEPITDSFIVAKVKIEFDRRSQLRDLDVKVKAREGTVRLSGVVDDDRQAELAVQTASEVEGVAAVENALEVRR